MKKNNKAIEVLKTFLKDEDFTSPNLCQKVREILEKAEEENHSKFFSFANKKRKPKRCGCQRWVERRKKQKTYTRPKGIYWLQP